MTNPSPTAHLPMTVLLYGASGMIGQGVLRECLLDDRVGEVRAVVRRPLGRSHSKLREVVTTDLAAGGDHLRGVDLTFHSAGPSANGMKEPEYWRHTYDLSLSIGRAVAAASPGSGLVYVSGAGTKRDSRMMWARVKGETEDALAALPLRVWSFRPGLIRALHGTRPTTGLYRALDTILGPVMSLLSRVAPGQVTDTERLGRAALQAVTTHAPPGVVTSAGINDLAATSTGPH
ncbi:hypothetical protein [Klenkia taihuensis]|uniref:NAD(P)H-binding n=1 Tax=Klenkia taihuensis TaxID=1225127 RepID=A0A1I1U3C6_9ACTN|nr:hypothetical protein [Klenkia taihuensis]GHE07033.1 epimerase [Klenkia taihuensis]SFD64088.1 hypothetical protein SAMN05661030_3853 [Klenkia taihuensis]